MADHLEEEEVLGRSDHGLHEEVQLEDDPLERSIASLSVVDGGVDVDLGESYLHIESTGDLDISVKRGPSPRRSRASTPRRSRTPTSGRSRSRSGRARFFSDDREHFRESDDREQSAGRERAEQDGEQDTSFSSRAVDDFLKRKGFDPDMINQAAAKAADGFFSDDDDDDEGASESARGGAVGASGLDTSLEERLMRLERMLNEETGGGGEGEGVAPAQTAKATARDSVGGGPTPAATSKDSVEESQSVESASELEARMERLDKLLGESADDEPEQYQQQQQQQQDEEEGEEESSSALRPVFARGFGGGDDDEISPMPGPRSPGEDLGDFDQYNFGGPENDAWEKLNRSLERAGFNSVALDQSGMPEMSGTAGGLFGEIREILNQYEQRGQMIEELTTDANRALGHDDHLGKQLESKTREADRLHEKLRRAEARIRELEEGSRAAQTSETSQAKSLRLENAALQQKLSLSEHRVKAKEAIVERLQRKLEAQVRRQESQTDKTKSLFQEIEKRGPRPSSVKDQRMLEAIQSFEEERAALEEENNLLNAEVRRLNESLQEKDNVLTGSKEAYLGTLEEQMRRKAQQVEHEKVASRRELEQRERTVMDKVGKLQRQLAEAEAERQRLEDHVENLKLELASRPTMRDWKAAQRRISKLETQVQAAVEALEEQDVETARAQGIFVPRKRSAGARGRDGLSTRERVELMAQRAVREKADNARRVSTAEMIRRDKLNHRLGLGHISALPKSTAHEILQEVCRVLEIADVELIVPALQKMCWLVRAMPRMEQFVKDVSSFVALHGDDTARETAARRAERNKGPHEAMGAVLPQLQRWVTDIRKLNATRDFREAVRQELTRSRGAMAARAAPGTTIGDTDGAGASLDPKDMSEAQLLQYVKDLLEMEAKMMEGQGNFAAAESYVREHPEVLANRCVTHLQQLFGIRSLEGVLPKLNELYVFVNEMNNFLQVLRPTLGLAARASVHACLAKVQELALRADGAAPAHASVVASAPTPAAPATDARRFYLPQWD